MARYINPEYPGNEKRPRKVPHERPQVKNLYCPRDGHYCEQPNCENCMFETVSENAEFD